MLTRALVTAAAILAMPGIARAQSRPDFSGEWMGVDAAPEQRSVAAVGDAAFRMGDMGAGWGSPLTLRQQGNQFIVEYTQFSTYDLQPKLRFVFALDGSESRNSIMIGHAESVARSRAMWRDSTLVITTNWPAPQGVTTSEIRQVLVLESSTSLLIETTRGATTTRTHYRKS
jgi:arylsulfatase